MNLYSLAPSVSPVYQVARISGSIVLVSWTRLTLSEARGFITNYTVTYSSSSGGSKQQMQNTLYQIVSAALNETTIEGLDESTAYLVQVLASTSVGAGVLSEPLLVTRRGNFFFVLVIVVVSVYSININWIQKFLVILIQNYFKLVIKWWPADTHASMMNYVFKNTK